MPEAPLPSSDYRRAARRVRWVHRDHPLRRARSLSELSRRFDQRTESIPASGPIASVRQFAQRVATELDGPTLLYSNRLKLLRAARRHGIRRFDANLIIAAVQERVKTGVQASALGVRSSGLRVQDRAPWRGWLVNITLALIFQTVIFLAWYLVVGA